LARQDSILKIQLAIKIKIDSNVVVVSEVMGGKHGFLISILDFYLRIKTTNKVHNFVFFNDGDKKKKSRC
jgi:hypothetical protein